MSLQERVSLSGNQNWQQSYKVTVTTKAFQNTSKCKEQSIKSTTVLKWELAP
jgi:hypothetical protein